MERQVWGSRAGSPRCCQGLSSQTVGLASRMFSHSMRITFVDVASASWRDRIIAEDVGKEFSSQGKPISSIQCRSRDRRERMGGRAAERPDPCHWQAPNPIYSNTILYPMTPWTHVCLIMNRAQL